MAGKRQLVVFKIGSEEFAVDIMLTREVVVEREVTAVPETEAYVEGVMNLRGNLVPVLDLGKRLRARPAATQAGRRIIVADLGGKPIGLIVDGASEVIRVTDDLIEPAPDIISEFGAEYVKGVINLGTRFITLVDLKKALTEEIVCELDDIMRKLAGHREGDVTPAQALRR